MKILIVDDNALNIKLLRVTLQSEGLETVEASDGMEALAILEGEVVDVIISDILMPNMDGYRFCQAVRQSEQFGELPFIVYSSTYESSGDERLAMRFGADKFLRRPAPRKEILKAIQEVTEATKPRQARSEPSDALEVVKTYSVELVRKLADKNKELTQAHARILGMHQTLLKRTDELEQSEAKFRSIFENILDVFYQTDIQGRIQMVSPSVQRYGYSPEMLIGTNVKDLYANPEVRDKIINTIQKQNTLEDMEVMLKRRSGETFVASCSVRLMTDFQKRPIGIEGIWRDMTERKRLEAQLLQAQKLESIGRLAGGIAHDFNNLLTAILGYTELAVEECALDVDVQEYLGNVKLAAEKAAHLTGQLLAFARKQVIEPKIVNLNTLILSLDKMLRRLIGENIELVLLPEEDLHNVKVDPGQFEQIVVNLVVNARDAMPHGGKISLETANVTLDEEYARQHEEVVPGEYVLLAASDTGSGIDESIRLHIFEPFFTTKEKGRGTGLGLATVYGIVRQAGGHIWLYSEMGEGTTFRIYLPRTTEPLNSASASRSLTRPSGGSETILLVEDEASVRTLTLRTLQQRGYTVLEAMNGEEALRLVKGREQEITLLITDVIMPQMSGKELADQLKRLHPGLNVLYTSGYTENTIIHHGLLDDGIAFLSKPFTPTALAQRVREILDSIENTSS